MPDSEARGAEGPVNNCKEKGKTMKKLIIGIIFAVTANALLVVPHAVQAADAAALEFTVEKDLPYYSEEALAREGDYARNRCKLDVRVPVGVNELQTALLKIAESRNCDLVDVYVRDSDSSYAGVSYGGAVGSCFGSSHMSISAVLVPRSPAK